MGCGAVWSEGIGSESSPRDHGGHDSQQHVDDDIWEFTSAGVGDDRADHDDAQPGGCDWGEDRRNMDQRGHDQPDGAQKFGEAERLEQRGGKVVDPAAKSSSY